MRRMMVLAAVVAALGMVSQPTEARDRSFGFRHFSGHAMPKLHLRNQGFKFHHGGFVGKPRPFKSRHFGHFDHRGSAFKFGHAPHFEPRHVLGFGVRAWPARRDEPARLLRESPQSAARCANRARSAPRRFSDPETRSAFDPGSGRGRVLIAS